MKIVLIRCSNYKKWVIMITLQTILDCDKYNNFYGIPTCYLKIKMWNIYVYIIIRFYFLLTQHIIFFNKKVFEFRFIVYQKCDSVEKNILCTPWCRFEKNSYKHIIDVAKPNNTNCVSIGEKNKSYLCVLVTKSNWKD